MQISVLQLKIQFLFFMHARYRSVFVFLPEPSTAAQQNNYAVRARMDSTAILQLYEFGLVASLVGGRHHRAEA